MAYTIQVDENCGLIFVHYSMPTSVSELREVAIQNSTDPARTKLRKRIHDLRSVSFEAGIDSEEIRAYAEFYGNLRDELTGLEIRVASIMSRDLEYGLARMWEIRVETRSTANKKEVRVFRTFREAANWVGLAEDYPDLSSCALV